MLKSKQKDGNAQIMTVYANKVASLKLAKTRDQIERCMLEIKECEKLLSSNDEQMSFKGWPKATKERFLRACDYSDVLWEIKNANGQVIGYLSAYYICAHDWPDHEGKCLTLILSKEWCKFYDDPLALGQRWHCNACGVRQRTYMGMVLEIWQADQFLYAKIPVKDFDTIDLQGMVLESKEGEAPPNISRPKPYTSRSSDKPRTRESTSARP